MSEMSFEQMLDASLKSIHAGEIVTGKVISVKPDEIALNIGYKSDGIMTRSDYSADNTVDLTTVVNVGDEIECKVKKVNDGEGQVVLSHREALASKASEELKDAFENQTVLTGKVVQVVKGGLNVEVNGARVFIPASLVSDTFERDLTKYQGQDIQFVITEFNPMKRRVIGDRKQLMAATKKEQHDKLFSELQVGDVRTGVVKNLTDFGAFIDLGGADGLLHISEMSWGRIENPKKLFKSGQEVKVLVKEINGERIALTRKFPDENPWKDAETKFAVGTVVSGKVARMTDFGAFVELEKGIDALLHVSQISREHVNKPSDVLEVGQEIEAKIVDLDVDSHKISLSMKALSEPERKEDLDVADVDIEAVGKAEAERVDEE
ncbi:30S ribosomal protein S1 [Oribacterium sp. P9]|jgi:ribosomal protein S1|uniref:30S ribosomal protein S1 n=1 Tax=Oribacterium sp. P9 TaxID=3378068 RepID=UPI002A79D756|nr:30S ribosomal protein S1 [Oribacterium sp.]MDD6519654.1 30S ribosomal protein S1 [Oribacterium sp.]MDY2854537.1 30S ribosomal protein S1 [Oliverpabstia sp.]MEE1377198.1 30S ribosomal protein S1 [Oribacterium sp.]